MDYSKLLKQDLIELLEQRSFADFIYKEEAEMRKIILKQNADKDEQIKRLHKDIDSEKTIKDSYQRRHNQLEESISLIKDKHNNELQDLKIKTIKAELQVDHIDVLLSKFFRRCSDEQAKELLFSILKNRNLSSTQDYQRRKGFVFVKEEEEDDFSNLDLDFDELDREVSASQDLDLDDDDLDLDFDEFEDDLDDSLSAELDDDLDDDLDEDLDLDDDLDDLDLDFDELEDKPETKSFIESVMNRKK